MPAMALGMPRRSSDRLPVDRFMDRYEQADRERWEAEFEAEQRQREAIDRVPVFKPRTERN